MGNKSRIRMLGEKYKEKFRDRIGKTLGEEWKKHFNKTYPYSEEDKEGIITWESPKKCRMKFKELTVKEGYDKTVKMYKRAHLYNHVFISIDNGFVVVQF